MTDNNIITCAKFPKATSIFVHTGNILSVNRLKRKPSQQPAVEVEDCLRSIIATWIHQSDELKLQYLNDLHISLPNQDRVTFCTAEQDVKISVKLFLNHHPTPDVVSEALDGILEELKIKAIDSLIVQIPQKVIGQIDWATFESVWGVLEDRARSGEIIRLGVCDFKVSDLEQLFNRVEIKPSTNQVQLADCCVMPPEMTEFAKANDIQLLTHNDPSVLLSGDTFRTILSEVVTDWDSQGWELSWVARYSAFIVKRGVIKDKGCIAAAIRDLKRAETISFFPG